MGVTIGNRSIIMTASGDLVNRPIRVLQARLVGTGMTPGQRLTVRDRGVVGGKIVIDHYVIAANEDAVVFDAAGEGAWFDRPYLDAAPATGTWTLIFQIL